MVYRAHKRPDGRAAKAPNGRAITSGAECCDCGGGGGPDQSACYDGCPTIVHADAACGIPDGLTPSFPTWIITIVGLLTYEDSVIWRDRSGVETLVSDVRRQTKAINYRIDVPRTPRPVCSYPLTFVAGDSQYDFVQSAPPSSRRYAPPTATISLVNTISMERNGNILWNVPQGSRSSWQISGPPTASGTNENTVSSVGADAASRYGLTVGAFAGPVPVGFQTLLAGRWTPGSQVSFCQTALATTLSPADLASLYFGSSSGFADATATASRTGCLYTLRHTGNGQMSGVRPGTDTYTASMTYSFDYAVTLRLGRCTTNGLRGPGNLPVDPAVEAIFREYGGCKGCGDGNPLA